MMNEEDDAEMSAINSLMQAEKSEAPEGEWKDEGEAKPDPNQVVMDLEKSIAQLRQLVSSLG